MAINDGVRHLVRMVMDEKERRTPRRARALSLSTARKCCMTTKATEGGDTPRKRRARKPRIDTMIRQAEKAGKIVMSVTVEGVTLTFGQPRPAKHNSWDDLEETGTRQ